MTRGAVKRKIDRKLCDFPLVYQKAFESIERLIFPHHFHSVYVRVCGKNVL